MDRKIEQGENSEPAKPDGKAPRGKAHLMCRTPSWGVAGFLGCAYFVWISYGHIARSEYDWPHDLWTAATYLIWIILLAGVALETRCRRERLFFGVLVVNFVAGGTLTLWNTVTPAKVRVARILTGALWALAALVSLTTLGRSDVLEAKDKNS